MESTLSRNGKKPKRQEIVGRIKLTPAAQMLGISKRHLQKMIDADKFSVQRDCDEGDQFVMVDEIRLWIETVGTHEERSAALLKFRCSKGRIKKR